MNYKDLHHVCAKLDHDLARLPKSIGIVFGHQLFKELERRSLITPQKFAVLQSALGLETIPAYRRSHVAFVSEKVAPDTYRIGQMATSPC